MEKDLADTKVGFIIVPGTPNGMSDTEYPGGFYCPTNQPVRALAQVYGREIHAQYFDWADDPNLPRKGLLGRHARHVPIYALLAMFESYQNDPKMRRFILEKLKAEILKSRKNTDDLYLIGHSLGAAIVCEAVKELILDGKIKEDEGKRLYLLLLSPAIGPLMGGMIRPTLNRGDLETVASFVDGLGEVRVRGDLLSADTGWRYFKGADPTRIWSETIEPPFGESGVKVGLGTVGHTRVGRWSKPILQREISKWFVLPPRAGII